jgi:hypothetical protein
VPFHFVNSRSQIVEEMFEHCGNEILVLPLIRCSSFWEKSQITAVFPVLSFDMNFYLRFSQIIQFCFSDYECHILMNGTHTNCMHTTCLSQYQCFGCDSANLKILETSQDSVCSTNVTDSLSHVQHILLKLI